MGLGKFANSKTAVFVSGKDKHTHTYRRWLLKHHEEILLIDEKPFTSYRFKTI
jgi:hypothetical protein